MDNRHTEFFNTYTPPFHTSTLETRFSTPTKKQTTLISQSRSGFDDISLGHSQPGSDSDDNNVFLNTVDNVAALGLSFEAGDSDIMDPKTGSRFQLESPRSATTTRSSSRSFNLFSRWSQRFYKANKKTTRRSSDPSDNITPTELEIESCNSPTFGGDHHHNKSSLVSSSPVSSSRFVTAMKSASISLSSFSSAQRSRRAGLSSHHYRNGRGSASSTRTAYLSEDSISGVKGTALDPEVMKRSLQRRGVLEEIINTEESYLADIRSPINLYQVYVTLLVSIPALSPGIRNSINQNLNDIVELHDEILGELHLVIPHSEYTQLDYKDPNSIIQINGHKQWRSLDVVPGDTGETTWLHQTPGMTAEPNVAAKVAQVFVKRISRFFIYEEYGSKYELMIKDIASVYRTIPQWDMYQTGLEALAATLAPLRMQQQGSFKKTMTIGDLLVKPIQRVCKYPLLFAELLKQTPVCDCPNAHTEIQNALTRLREVVSEINRAADDPRMRLKMERSWLLQDRLVLPDEFCSRSRDIIRSFGHVRLCGVLYVSWQTDGGVDGQHFICVLYREFLILASASKSVQIYTVKACISLRDIRIEETSNGTGLLCCIAPYSWKLLFECDNQLFEMIMSACSPKEELEWRSRLDDSSNRDILGTSEQAAFTTLVLEIKLLGEVFGKPGTMARRLSVQQATTTSSHSGSSRIIIKNSIASKDPYSSTSSSSNQPQPLLSTHRIPILIPLRHERIQLEALLSDVWTSDVLPYPGISGRARGEGLHLSAQQVMRKLSVASIARNFTKRSASVTTTRKLPGDNESNGPDPCLLKTRQSEESSQPTMPHLKWERAQKPSLPLEQDYKDCLQGDFVLNTPRDTADCTHKRTTRRISPSKILKKWGQDSQRMVTPPLRNSSANSIDQNRVTPVSGVSDKRIEDKENKTQPAATWRRDEDIF
ncbi:hypothetical protein B7463_g12568, partial [Scytalidium lignicola]